MKKWRARAWTKAKRLSGRRLHRARNAYYKLFATRLFDIHMRPLIRLKIFKQIGGSR